MDEYIQEVLDAIIGKGALSQAKAFREGFSKVFPISDLQAFTTDEFVVLFGNSEEDWSLESRLADLIPCNTLTALIRPSHRYHRIRTMHSFRSICESLGTSQNFAELRRTSHSLRHVRNFGDFGILTGCALTRLVSSHTTMVSELRAIHQRPPRRNRHIPK